MKKYLLIIFTVFFFSSGFAQVEPIDSLSFIEEIEDDLPLLKVEPADTALYEKEKITPVQLDQSQLEEFRSDKDFDYYSHIVKDDRSWLDLLKLAIIRWLFEHLNMNVSVKQVGYGLYIIGGIVVAFFIFILFKYRPSFFSFNKRLKHQIKEEDETIYGIDFEKLINQALNAKDYFSAIRWKYLQTLRWMEEKEQIVWNPNKTVNEYVYEMKDSELKYLFKDISYLFLYFRYGNFEATEEHFHESKEISNKIKNKLDS